MVENYGAGQSWVDIGTAKDKDGKPQFLGFSYKTDVKSLVWYSPENFADAGYEVPKTMEELIALSDKIVADGGKPWCIGLGSGGATGWPATDWIEDIMLRTQSPDVYDKWVTNEVKFTDPAVTGALDIFGSFAKNDAYVDGGAAGVASTDFRDSPKGLFTTPPKCYMHHQASFIPSFFPEGTKMGEDADFFYFPTYASKPELGKPVLGAGTLFTITKDSKAARAFIDFLKLPLAHELWMADGGFLTPLKSANPAAYANDAARKQGDIMATASTFRFDGSDLMPAKLVPAPSDRHGGFCWQQVSADTGADIKKPGLILSNFPSLIRARVFRPEHFFSACNFSRSDSHDSPDSLCVHNHHCRCWWLLWLFLRLQLAARPDLSRRCQQRRQRRAQFEAAGNDQALAVPGTCTVVAHRLSHLSGHSNHLALLPRQGR
jgi:hypothetical protein